MRFKLQDNGDGSGKGKSRRQGRAHESEARFRTIRIVVVHLVAIALFAARRPLSEITINMSLSYSDEGSTPPHPENPSWDPAGVILKAHFARVKQIWEQLLPGPGSFAFDFEWDNNIGATTLGSTTNLGLEPLFHPLIEINANQTWYAAPFPATDDDFSTAAVQTLYSGLTPQQQPLFFAGNLPLGSLETGYMLLGNAGANGAGGYNAANGYDLLSTIMQEIGHVLGISSVTIGTDELYHLR